MAAITSREGQEELRRRTQEKYDASAYGDLDRSGQAASAFADQGQADFGQRGQMLNTTLGRLGDIASGKVSLSAEQLRAALQQNMASQQAMAGQARGGNQMMAARNASMNSARMGSGLAGQQAMAGIAERDAANRAMLGGLGQARGQDLQAALGSRGQAISAHGARIGANPQQGGGMSNEQMAMMAASAAAMFSDERLKENVGDGDTDAKEFMKALKAYSYDYKDQAHGKGKQLGVMAQDLERTKFGKQTVFDTPKGKMVDAAKLAGALAASTANLNKRLSKLEGDE